MVAHPITTQPEAGTAQGFSQVLYFDPYPRPGRAPSPSIRARRGPASLCVIYFALGPSSIAARLPLAARGRGWSEIGRGAEPHVAQGPSQSGLSPPLTLLAPPLGGAGVPPQTLRAPVAQGVCLAWAVLPAERYGTGFVVHTGSIPWRLRLALHCRKTSGYLHQSSLF